jgi:integrase
VNLAIKTRKLKISNPFSHVSLPKDDGVEREPLSEAEMALVRDNLRKLSPHDQLLWKWLACTGMRLSEPFEIDRKYEENGVRYVIVGTKTRSSRRRVPIPTELLPAERIEGPLFKGNPETVAKRLRYFLKRLKISHDPKAGTGNPAKVVHSLRHRAKDRLRSAHCSKDIQHHILGHDEVTVADGYGTGYPMDVLLPYVDKIGW